VRCAALASRRRRCWPRAALAGAAGREPTPLTCAQRLQLLLRRVGARLRPRRGRLGGLRPAPRRLHRLQRLVLDRLHQHRRLGPHLEVALPAAARRLLRLAGRGGRRRLCLLLHLHLLQLRLHTCDLVLGRRQHLLGRRQLLGLALRQVQLLLQVAYLLLQLLRPAGQLLLQVGHLGVCSHLRAAAAPGHTSARLRCRHSGALRVWRCAGPLPLPLAANARAGRLAQQEVRARHAACRGVACSSGGPPRGSWRR
jgi:hypothetical protein